VVEIGLRPGELVKAGQVVAVIRPAAGPEAADAAGSKEEPDA
jgi:hypothetical protein